jgi:hypothetical protein
VEADPSRQPPDGQSVRARRARRCPRLPRLRDNARVHRYCSSALLDSDARKLQTETPNHLVPDFPRNISGRSAPREEKTKETNQIDQTIPSSALRAEQAKRNDRAFLPRATRQERGSFFFLAREETSLPTSLRIVLSDPLPNLFLFRCDPRFGCS